MTTTRRGFIERSTAGLLTSALAAQTPPSSTTQTTVGLIGSGIRGTWLMKPALDAGAKIAIVADLYDGHLRRAKETLPDAEVTRDYKKVLARQDVQAVIIATADHWHAPIAMDAMRAGKDVYCEKPMSHTIEEAIAMGKVSRETGRLIQVGSQSLSMQTTRKAKQWVDSGAIGNVYMVQCSINRASASGAWRYPIPSDASPSTIDWERFLGNAPKRPFDPARFFHFRNWWDYGTGISGDEYVHLLSRAHYVLGVTYPLNAMSQGGVYKWTGDREVPDIHNTLYDYGKFQVQVSANLASNWEGGEIVRFMGDKGTIELQKWVVKLFPYAEHESDEIDHFPKDQKAVFQAANPPKKRVTQPKPETFEMTREGTEDHFRNLFECIRTRQQPVENVDFGTGTAVACHMANIAYLKKKPVYWDASRMHLQVG